MIPQSCASGTIDLFRATCFPGGWVKEATLVTGLTASDPTLVSIGGAGGCSPPSATPVALSPTLCIFGLPGFPWPMDRAFWKPSDDRHCFCSSSGADLYSAMEHCSVPRKIVGTAMVLHSTLLGSSSLTTEGSIKSLGPCSRPDPDGKAVSSTRSIVREGWYSSTGQPGSCADS